MAKSAAERLQPEPRPKQTRRPPTLALLVLVPAGIQLLSPPRLLPEIEATATTGQVVIGTVTGIATGTDVAPTAAAAAMATTAVGNHRGRTRLPADGEAETDADADRRTTRPVTPLTRVRPAAAVIGDGTAKGSATR